MIRLSAPLIGDEEIAAAGVSLASGRLVQGPEVATFEQEFAEIVDGRACVAVNSGTSALQLCLLVNGIGPGDEVIVPSFTFAATANAVCLGGADVVFADIEPETFGLDPAAVTAAISPRTAAIIVVHMYGNMGRIEEIERVADRHGLLLVEDAAQAHGAASGGRPAGAWGKAAAFSFYATKNMTTGEGGMVVLNGASEARRARLLRNQGMERQYDNEVVGFNMRMSEVAGAIGRVQLRRLPGFNEDRRRHAEILDKGLAGVVAPPVVRPGSVPVFHQYTVRVPERDAVRARLHGEGVESGVYYPVPVHRLGPHLVDAGLPETDRAAAEVLSLPVGPHIDDDDAAVVAEALCAAVGR